MRKRIAFIGGFAVFQAEIACQNPDNNRDGSFWILLASKVSKTIFLSFFLDEKSNKKIKAKRSLPTLFILKIRNRRRTKAPSGSSKNENSQLIGAAPDGYRDCQARALHLACYY